MGASTTLPAGERYVATARDPRLRWGITGTGFMAGCFAHALKHRTRQLVVAVSSRLPVKAMRFASDHGIAHAVTNEGLFGRSDVDAVLIAAPASEHLPLAMGAIAAGKHVLVEKPLATNAADARTLVDAARTAGVLLMEAMSPRYHPQTGAIRRLLEDGALGEVHSVIADYGQHIPNDRSHRLRRPELGGGALLDLGVYCVQLASMVFGSPCSITALGAVGETGVDEHATILLDHGTHDHSVLVASIVTQTPTRGAICGSRARIEMNGPFTLPGGFTLIPNDRTAPLLQFDSEGAGFLDALGWEVNAFVRYVGEGLLESPVHSLRETEEVLTTLDEARRQVHAEVSDRRANRR